MHKRLLTSVLKFNQEIIFMLCLIESHLLNYPSHPIISNEIRNILALLITRMEEVKSKVMALCGDTKVSFQK